MKKTLLLILGIIIAGYILVASPLQSWVASQRGAIAEPDKQFSQIDEPAGLLTQIENMPLSSVGFEYFLEQKPEYLAAEQLY